MHRLPTVLRVGVVLAAATLPAQAPTPGSTARAGTIGVRAVDLDGRVHRLGIGDRTRPVTLVFFGTECPISNRYAGRLGELAALAAERGVGFYGVLSDPDTTVADAVAHRDEYGLNLPILFDATGELATRLGPTHVPEAFVVSATDTLLYRGRIDDRFAALGRPRANVASHDLADAIEAAAAGRAPDTARTEPVGCLFEAWNSGALPDAPTYARHVEPLLRAHCVECHRTGEVAPFELTSYRSAKRRARMLAEVCGEGLMPPWRAAPQDDRFRDERRLGAREVELLRAWAASGAPEGEPSHALPPTAERASGWRLGEPDLVVELPAAFPVPADGDDIYRVFVLPTDFEQDRVVVATEFRPGEPSVVHHSICYIDTTGQARRRDAADDSPGFSSFDQRTQSFLFRSPSIGGWSPGKQPYRLPSGIGRRLPAGSDLMLEVHYHPIGKAMTDRSRLAVYFAETDDLDDVRLIDDIVIGTERIDIEAGDADYGRHVWMELPGDATLFDITPHAHYLGREFRVDATLPGGERRSLIHIPAWDFRWQDQYVYADPIRLPKGTRIDARVRYDNSADNPANPHAPPRRVRNGWRTTDEMCLIYMSLVLDDASHGPALRRAMLASFGRRAELRDER